MNQWIKLVRSDTPRAEAIDLLRSVFRKATLAVDCNALTRMLRLADAAYTQV